MTKLTVEEQAAIAALQVECQQLDVYTLNRIMGAFRDIQDSAKEVLGAIDKLEYAFDRLPPEERLTPQPLLSAYLDSMEKEITHEFVSAVVTANNFRDRVPALLEMLDTAWEVARRREDKLNRLGVRESLKRQKSRSVGLRCPHDQKSAGAKRRWRIAENYIGRWMILHPDNDNLAWSGAEWVKHRDNGVGVVQHVADFDSPFIAEVAAEKLIDIEDGETEDDEAMSS